MAQADKLGQAMQLFSVLANNTDWSRMDWQKVQWFIDKPKEAGKRFNAFLDIAGSEADATVFHIVVKYPWLFADRIKAGDYFWTDSDITSGRFPVKGEGVVELNVELVHLNRSVSSEEAVKEIERRGLRPAKIEELLAFGAAYPKKQWKYPIAALGSVARIRGRRHVPRLGLYDGEWPSLGLEWWDSDWSGNCRLLAVRN